VRLSERLRLLRGTEGAQKWIDAERLWSDLHNAVLTFDAPPAPR
jgi:hypothetical protein